MTLCLGTAIDILREQEIQSCEQHARAVNSPTFVKGLVSLRAEIVPIVDLRLKLHIEPVEYSDATVVISLNIFGTVVGAAVDSVEDVLTISSDAIKPSHQFESAMDSTFVVGSLKAGERMLIVMNAEALMSNSELGMLA